MASTAGCSNRPAMRPPAGQSRHGVRTKRQRPRLLKSTSSTRTAKSRSNSRNRKTARLRKETNNMHSLEHLLFIASLRIKAETGNKRLADDVMALASASHNYEPVAMSDGKDADKHLEDWNERWSRKYRHLIHPKLKKGN